jgi:dephospho-CoA kinase
MTIIGIAGTIGAGKGTVVDYLKTKNFTHYSARDFIVREIERRGLPVSRDTMAEVANDLRVKHSPSYIIDSLLADAKRAGQGVASREASQERSGAVIESIRTEGEIQSLRREPQFILLAVDADPKLRYERVVARGGATDRISFEKFRADEAREFSSSDPHKQNLSRCIVLADYKLTNNGSFDELHAHVDDILKAIAS